VATVRALLLDAVGTLIALREPPALVYTRTARACGLRVDEAQVASRLASVRIGPPALEGVPLDEIPARERAGWREVVRSALGDAAADGATFERLWAHYATGAAWRLEPDALASLESLRGAGWCAGVVSNMDVRLARVLDDLGVLARIDTLVNPASCGRAKPDPETFHAALRRLGAAAAHSVYVGDRERDCVAAARRAGLRGIVYAPAAGVDWRSIARQL
jgi:putative hydrolase of the HAD superfamily